MVHLFETRLHQHNQFLVYETDERTYVNQHSVSNTLVTWNVKPNDTRVFFWNIYFQVLVWNIFLDSI